MTLFCLARPALALILLSGFSHVPSAHGETERVEQSRFSGKAVPRFGTLRYDAVNGRQGPSLQHQILWRYEKEGLPVIVVRETHNWVRVRDAAGDEVWMQTRMIEDERNLLIQEDTVLKKHPSADSADQAKLKQGLIVKYRGCDQSWCAVQIGRRSGYVSEDHVWGADAQ
ncbi:MAG: SH3 domain-containing protein [Pseudomonadota bacterium]